MKHWNTKDLNEHQRKLLQKACDNIKFPNADLESNISNAQMGTNEATQMVTPCSIHFHSRRYRLADPDGLSGKAIIDGIVHSGVLADDTTKEITNVSFSQEKIKRTEKEVTIITLETI